MKPAVIFDEIYLKHDLPTHPENALRLKYFLKSLPEFDIDLLKPKPVSYEILTAVHSENYIEDVRISCSENAPGFFDADTYYNIFTFDAAIMAAGAVEKAVELVKEEKYKKIFCAVRPPGHHATKDRAMGFCIFNNVAVGAVKALSLGFQKVFIVDFDAHHGNGTQEILQNIPSIFYFSTHQYPFYPGTGSPEENRENILNVPLNAGSGDYEYAQIYTELLPQKIEPFQPELILVSAGYDIHRDDPLTDLEVTDKGVEIIVNSIIKITNNLNIPVIFSLEGGYNLHALERCGRITFAALSS
ncbi:Acetoin utilization deacetylase AcuC [Desulfurobacterium pacificum]|uniref:Acetoin utilization deacetylase AcuC n=1 Tax=Desulfurobacterium pacificum TaxID=240166 RepID=A0ABY1NV23_9BACT|nr:histone deacetylase [Desulfurobacterium pacificum]SMP18806.1 Acetoin utilization deacetylase AcuC [Desulfurobacterium pacificum]